MQGFNLYSKKLQEEAASLKKRESFFFSQFLFFSVSSGLLFG